MDRSKYYSIDFFIKKFENMPEEYMGFSYETNPSDVWEWTYCDEEAMALYNIARPYGLLVQVNDGNNGWSELGDNPKERVVSFLKYIKMSK